MRTMLIMISMLLSMSVLTGCWTAATAYTKRTLPDKTVIESKVRVSGMGDKASNIIAEGLFADGNDDDLGAGVKTASASQQSSGWDNIVTPLINGLVTAVAQRNVVTAAPTESASVSDPSVCTISSGIAASPTVGYTAEPGPGGIGVYGRPICPNSQAYLRNHPDVTMIDYDTYKSTCETALRARGYTGGTIILPIEITDNGYTIHAK